MRSSDDEAPLRQPEAGMYGGHRCTGMRECPAASDGTCGCEARTRAVRQRPRRNHWHGSGMHPFYALIASRYQRLEIAAPPEIRSRGSIGSFNHFRSPVAHLPPVEDPPPDHGPTPDPPPVEQPPPLEDQVERFLVLLFLRRCITWCARCHTFARMNGAARLFVQVDRERCCG